MALPLPNSPTPMPLTALLQDEDPDVRVDVAEIFDDPDAWFQAPNAHLGGASPEEAVQSGREMSVRNLLRQIKYIGMT